MTPDDYTCRTCHAAMHIPDGMDPLEEDVRLCSDCAYAEIERLQDEVACLRPTGRSAVYDDYVATVNLVTEFWQNGSLKDRVRAMAEDRQRLQAIVALLPTTADVNTQQIRERASRGGLPDVWRDEVYRLLDEIERLQKILSDVRATGIEVIIEKREWIAIPRSVWMEASKCQH